MVSPRLAMQHKSTLTSDDLSFHNAIERLRYLRVRFWTLEGTQCGPSGLGEFIEDDLKMISDTRLTCPGHLTVDTILGMPDWIRFATEEERVAQRAAGEVATWWRPLEMKVKAFVIGKGDAARVAHPDYAIGSDGTEVTVLGFEPEVHESWVDRVVDVQLLDGVHTPSTPDILD